MTTAAATDQGTRADKPRARARWWREVLYVIAFYVVYSAIRNTGASTAGREHAFTNAKRIIRAERLVGLYHEETLQDWFLPFRWFIRFWNIYYGSFHFIVTIVALVWCFRARPDRYPRWRNTLAATTALALIGFAFFPLMPPRLLPPSYGFVDTLAHYGGLWSFDSGTMKAVSNQYAAMPSLHFGWSSWCAFVLWPAAGDRTWAKALLVSSEKARQLLGWDESDPDEALRRSVEWHLAHPPAPQEGSDDFSADDAALERRVASEATA